MGSQSGIDAAVVGADLEVPLVGGASARYVNLDYAASARALVKVWAAVQAFLPWYSSVHRAPGSDRRSRRPPNASQCGALVGGRTDDAVVFTRNTTDSINLLARCLPTGTVVITTGVEHHANLLPWRRQAAIELPVPGSPDELLERLEQALRRRPADRPALVAVTGASNVTGEVWPLAELAVLAHEHSARIFVDAAQLARHRPRSSRDEERSDRLCVRVRARRADFRAPGYRNGRGASVSPGPRRCLPSGGPSRQARAANGANSLVSRRPGA